MRACIHPIFSYSLNSLVPAVGRGGGGGGATYILTGRYALEDG